MEVFLVDLRVGYTGEDALADGVLIDVCEAARTVGITVPVYMTAGLWHGPYIQGQMEKVSIVLGIGPLCHDVRNRKFRRMAVPIINDAFPCPFIIYFETEPSQETEVIATVLAAGERLRFDMPRTAAGGSFFVV
jgi:hypothetical protein